MAQSSAVIEQRNQDATCYVGGLDDACDEELLWELCVQVGPVVSVHMPRDKVSGRHQNYAFVEYRSEEDADYAVKVLNMTKLYGKLTRFNKASSDKAKGLSEGVGANLFIGNLDLAVDEKVLYDTFSAFGTIPIPPKVGRDPDTGASKGFGFVAFDSFEASDLAIEGMHGQYLCNRPISVQYAFKRESRSERHGSAAERLLAAAARAKQSATAQARPNMLFAAAPGQVLSALPAGPGMIGTNTGAMPPPMLPPTAIFPASLAPSASHYTPYGQASYGGVPPPLPPAAYGAAYAAGPYGTGVPPSLPR